MSENNENNEKVNQNPELNLEPNPQAEANPQSQNPNLQEETNPESENKSDSTEDESTNYTFEKPAQKSEKAFFDRVIASKNATIETHKATIRELTEELNALKQAPVSED